MKKFLQKKLNNEKGLTLVELLAVIVILGVISAIAVPSIGGIIENSKYNAVKADAIMVLNAANLYFIEDQASTGTRTVLVSTLISEGLLESSGKIPGKVKTEQGTETGIDTTITKVAKGSVSITTEEITFSGDKKVKFTTATIAGINSDTNKGSRTGPFVINN